MRSSLPKYTIEYIRYALQIKNFNGTKKHQRFLSLFITSEALEKYFFKHVWFQFDLL